MSDSGKGREAHINEIAAQVTREARAEITARARVKAAGNMPPNGIKVGSDLHLCEACAKIVDRERQREQRIVNGTYGSGTTVIGGAVAARGVEVTTRILAAIRARKAQPEGRNA